ncbi:hypothetical protein HYC85_030412 [Camellia sinensis]|uniref:Uncharacterized protein n=1 Tax=Camellia sinensis TaxID=4442 RepID=A0A7J7G269_CAMSI|nr:hypothetical protein HYC85_030412 [Camellia sinensis]
MTYCLISALTPNLPPRDAATCTTTIHCLLSLPCLFHFKSPRDTPPLEPRAPPPYLSRSAFPLNQPSRSALLVVVPSTRPSSRSALLRVVPPTLPPFAVGPPHSLTSSFPSLVFPSLD